MKDTKYTIEGDTYNITKFSDIPSGTCFRGNVKNENTTIVYRNNVCMKPTYNTLIVFSVSGSVPALFQDINVPTLIVENIVVMDVTFTEAK